MYIYFNNVDLSTDLSTHQCLFMESQAVSLKPHSNTMKEALSLFPLYRWEMKALVLNNLSKQIVAHSAEIQIKIHLTPKSF